MSSKIYFSAKRRRAASHVTVRLFLNTMYFFAPNYTLRKVRSLLLRPARPKASIQDAVCEEFQVDSAAGPLQAYRLGQGPAILFVHGWAGTGQQFMPLMQRVAMHGYSAISFDMPAHGKSSGRESTLPGFITSVQHVLDAIGIANVAGLVCHSMGCTAALNAVHSKPLFLIAPLWDFYSNFHASVTRMGIPSKLFESVLAEVALDHGVNFVELEPGFHLDKLSEPMTIVHDKDDKFAPYEASSAILKKRIPVNLVTAQKQGHHRIIQSEVCQTELNSWLQTLNCTT